MVKYRLGIISDLHLEFRDTTTAIKLLEYIDSYKKEIDFLIIAGDIHSKKILRDYFLSQITIPYKFVMGNHDFYKHPVYDDFFDSDGIVGGCLWTNFNNNPMTELLASSQIWDYKYIPDWNTHKCKIMFVNQLHKILNSNSEIVVTHFTPSRGSITKQFKDDPLNGYFCNDLDNLILESGKKLWIHGHVHSNHDYKIGNCRIVSNVLGYPNELPDNFSLKIVDI